MVPFRRSLSWRAGTSALNTYRQLVKQGHFPEAVQTLTHDCRRPRCCPITASTPSASNRRFRRLIVLDEQNRPALTVAHGCPASRGKGMWAQADLVFGRPPVVVEEPLAFRQGQADTWYRAALWGDRPGVE
jgi:hypothetical protein